MVLTPVYKGEVEDASYNMYANISNGRIYSIDTMNKTTFITDLMQDIGKKVPDEAGSLLSHGTQCRISCKLKPDCRDIGQTILCMPKDSQNPRAYWSQYMELTEQNWEWNTTNPISEISPQNLAENVLGRCKTGCEKKTETELKLDSMIVEV